MEVGYKKPPIAHRFPPGVSGNPAGGKRGPRQKKVRPHPFDEPMEINTHSGVRTETKGTFLVLIARGLAIKNKDEKLNRTLQRQHQRARRALDAAKPRRDREWPTNVLWWAGSKILNSNDAVQHLGIGRILRPFSTKPKLMLESFIVQQAIDRMERNQLTLEEQIKVVQITRCAWKLKLPGWWHGDAKPKRKRGSDEEE